MSPPKATAKRFGATSQRVDSLDARLIIGNLHDGLVKQLDQGFVIGLSCRQSRMSHRPAIQH
jgi:hypothetical protein